LRQDILDFDFKKIRSSKKIKVIGNLPYYITTPILEYLLRNLSRIRFILITVQREVANRLLAQPGSKDYSSLTCFIRYYTEPLYVHTIKRTCFYPEPEVDSSLVMLKVLDKPSVKVADEELFFKIVRGAFNQRRKSIINSLSRQAVLDMAKERLSAVLKEIGIDPSIRPESLSLSDFASISTAVNPLSR
jgi:16S rRNA (adenine1518-N6/adenine1519-N6)-dimethyltransferase